MRAISILTIVVLGWVGPALAQRPAMERLQELRLQRMREALHLDEEQAAAIAQAMEEVRRAEREARERERQAFERLRASLRAEPVDQQAVREALEAIERERETVARARREHAERLKQRLTPEQQAKLMIFNRRFDQRLRELMAKRHAGPRMGPGKQGMRPGPGGGPRGHRVPGGRRPRD